MFQRVIGRRLGEGLLRNTEGRETAVVSLVDQILTRYGEVLQEPVPDLSW